MNEFTIEDAIILAAKNHKGQFDKGGMPYILHPIRVMLSVKGGKEQIVAILHDIVEDTDITINDLRALNVPSDVIGAVDILSKREDEDVETYGYRIIESKNYLAINVKWADMDDNSDPKRLQYLPLDKQQYLSVKYAEAKKRLRENT